MRRFVQRVSRNRSSTSTVPLLKPIPPQQAQSARFSVHIADLAGDHPAAGQHQEPTFNPDTARPSSRSLPTTSIPPEAAGLTNSTVPV